MSRNRHLPPIAGEFLGDPAHRGAERIVRRLHRWMVRKRLSLSDLRPQHVRLFLRRPIRNRVQSRTADQYRRRLQPYLAWLHERGVLCFDPSCIRRKKKRQLLPPSAEDFLRTLEPTHRPTTCTTYRASLKRFHQHLGRLRVQVGSVQRKHMQQWFGVLYDEGLHASTRLNFIMHARIYLRWLWENGLLEHPPDVLVRPGDLPKLPLYLPRPLSPELDQALQAQLQTTDTPEAQGLLLMRHTGLRVGELRALEYHCIREDPLGNRFLKVPLGKLNNERMVPITEEIHDLVRSLQNAHTSPGTYLLERTPGEPVPYSRIHKALLDVRASLPTDEAFTTHQLRHTYATALFSGGMSLVGVMKLLGHRDYRMTLRYTAVTLETVGQEYFAALEQLEAKYQINLTSHDPGDPFDPIKALSDLIAWSKKNVGAQDHERLAYNLVKRLRRLQDDLQPFLPPAG